MAVNLFNLSPDEQYSDPSLIAQLQPPLQGFAAHMANPTNLQAILPSIADRTSIIPQTKKPTSIFDNNQNWFAPSVDTTGMAPTMPSVPPPAAPQVQSQTDVDRNELQRLQTDGAGLNQIQNPLLRGLARVGDIAGSILVPHAVAQIPGTTAHNLQLQQRQAGIVGQDQQAQQLAQQQLQQRLQNQDTQSQIGLRNAQAAQIPATAKLKQDAQVQQAAQHGFKATFDDNDNLTGFEPDPDNPIYQRQKAQNDYFSARKDLADAQAELAKSKNDPNSPAFKQAQQKVDTAIRNASTAAGRLGLSSQEFAFNQDKFYNPQPTAAERGKGDLAQSAVERVAEMKAIVAKHPEYFGPGAGRATRAQEWLGSQDPEAQTYLSAAQYLSDHSAGVFGGRGKYITEALHSLTDPKMNPAALNAALDEADKAARGFVKAGTVHGKGGGNPPADTKVRKFNPATGRLE